MKQEAPTYVQTAHDGAIIPMDSPNPLPMTTDQQHRFAEEEERPAANQNRVYDIENLLKEVKDIDRTYSYLAR